MESSHKPLPGPQKITIIGNYPPRRCGIATFTQDTRDCLIKARPDCAVPVVAMTDHPGEYDYPEEVRIEIDENNVSAYERAGQFIEINGGQAISLQHEFGIFGGDAGEHILKLLDKTELPLVTTLHTVLTDPNDDQRRVFNRIARRSSRLIVMSEKGREILEDTWNVSPDRIAVIPHGIPDVPFTDSCYNKSKFDLQGRKVILTFGLLGTGKGLEDGIRAMPKIVKDHPDVTYVILGATHPNLVRHEGGEKYRESLIKLTEDLGVAENVRFVNEYVTLPDLCEWISACDVYLTPYLNEAQITSGTLAYTYGAGKAVVSTPYWHAKELLQDDCGKLVGFNDPAGIASAINELLDNPADCAEIRKKAYNAGRQMIWSEVAERYHEVFAEVVNESLTVASSDIPSRHRGLTTVHDSPTLNIDHVLRMSDSTGMFQHARHHLPWFEHGYCTDDNARALIFSAELEDADEFPKELEVYQSAYAAFLEHAFNADTRRFRNFLSFDRNWLEQVGSEDSHGRAVWSLGVTAEKTKNDSLKAWAVDIFEQSLEITTSFSSPRSWAFTVLGIASYLEVFPCDRLAQRTMRNLADRILDIYTRTKTSDWNWFEESVTYDNARLPQALILAGHHLGNSQYLQAGLSTLRWLQKNQTGHDGCFRPIGSNGFWNKNEEPAWYDQQPLEAAAATSACRSAATAEPEHADFWLKEANRSQQWFIGRNDLKISLYDKRSGGCYDGLRANRVNRNQGAESTLSFWLALADVKAMAVSQSSFETQGKRVTAQA